MTWDWDAVWSVLRWILLTLAVGFVGQFGRSLAMNILQKRRAAHQEEERKQNGPIPPDVQIEQAHIDAQAKIEKKRAKAEVKRKKKAAKTDSQDE